ncbi:hypothetical protein [Tateyamaria omphalii]|uniref:Response regulatory domain-containing protein n=1 Tax=Tateyamaria omphalii TaxID=299262 RepID=A0A1P8MUT4_9RHOB|nr:hypothetical protein [Tateyamaria omphalii]APX11857.1 hypothetical protein BWR18_09310 [Tateyamaria omphalii]
MQALIIDRQADRLDQSQIALMNAGVQVTGTGSLLVAETCIQRLCVDLLVIEKSTIADALGDTLGMAEDRNSHLVSILRTPDVGEDHDALSPHFPSLHCIVGQDVSNEVAIKLGLASLRAKATGSVMPARALRMKKPNLEAARAAYAARTQKPENIFAEAV